MKVLYIGQADEGSTSGMRAETLRNILQPGEFSLIDTAVPLTIIQKYLRNFCNQK